MSLGTIITILSLAAFLYFGYRDDYQRDKKGFVYTVISTILLLTGFILIFTKNTLLAWIFALVFILISIKLRSKISKKDNNS